MAEPPCGQSSGTVLIDWSNCLINMSNSKNKPSPSRRRPPIKERDADTESRILQAARVVFTRRGTAGARVQEIAAEAGVNQALIHYYFGTKENLAEQVFFESAAQMTIAMAVVVDPSATIEMLIERFVHAYIDTVRTAPFIPGYILAETTQNPERLDALMQRAIGTLPAPMVMMAKARLEQLVADGVAAGRIRPIATRQLLVSIMALVVFPFVARPILAAALLLNGADYDEFLDERRRELPGFILNALRP
jgi:TetR/AcrR family transcriptional regulator